MTATARTAAPQMLLEARGIDVRQGGLLALQNVSLSLARGEIVTIVGPNGSGKSTLLRVLIGALVPERGTLFRAPGLRVGYVPQSLHIGTTLPLTVRRFLDLPRRVSDDAARAALDEAGVAGVTGRQMAALSGGQFQRVLLARAILERPDILMLDEPTQGLDQPGSAAFYRQIEAVRAHLGCAVLMVSHELHVVMSASDRVICLNGHICCEGTPDVVRAAPAYRELFGTGTGGALALYRHDHDHDHDHEHDHGHDQGHGHEHGQGHDQGQEHAPDHDHGQDRGQTDGRTHVDPDDVRRGQEPDSGRDHQQDQDTVHDNGRALDNASDQGTVAAGSRTGAGT